MLISRNNQFLITTQSLVFLGTSLMGALLLSQGIGVPWVTLAATPIILTGWHYYEQMSLRLRRLYLAFLGIFLVIMVLMMLGIMVTMLDTHADGDFKHFWISAHIAIEGENFYDPALHHAVLAQLDPSEAPAWFVTRLVDTGFWYPPMSILLFLPLGLFDLQTAWILNYSLLTVIFLIAVGAIQKTFFPGSGRLGYTVLLTFILVLFPTRIIIEVSQTNFMLMLLVLLMWHHRDRPIAGLWLGLAIVVKPFVGVLILFLLLRKHWRATLNVVLTLAGLSLVTLLIYGTDTFLSYSPTGVLPASVYYEPINQGLLGMITRLVDFQFDDGQSPIFHPLYLASAGAVTLTSMWFVYFLPKSKEHIGFSLLVIASLLVYPTMLWHYSIFLIIPLFWLWSEWDTFPGSAIGAGLFITLIATMLSFRFGWHSFFPVLICWFVFAAAALKYLYAPNRPMPTLASITGRLPVRRVQERLSRAE